MDYKNSFPDPGAPLFDTAPAPSSPVLMLSSSVLTGLPVLASTHLCVELLTQSGALDLCAVTDLLGRDPGAVLRLYQQIAVEFPEVGSRPQKLKDCIASLQGDDLLSALSTPASARDEQTRFKAFAEHAFTIACFASAVASSLGLCEEFAYLLGLFHALGHLPAELGRLPMHAPVEAANDLASEIAKAHHLPSALREAVVAVHAGAAESLWVAVIQAAHDLAGGETSLRAEA